MEPVVWLLWAKSERGDQRAHRLWCHLLDAAAVCEALLPRFRMVSEIPDLWLAYLVGLHDIGKADRYFQNKDEAGSKILREAGLDLPPTLEDFRHEARSAEWLFKHLQETHGWCLDAADTAANAIRGHHGSFTCACDKDRNTLVRAEWNGYRNDLAKVLAETLNLASGSYTGQPFADASAVGIHLAGLTVLSDWIASNGEVYRYHELDNGASPRAYMAAAREEAAKAVRRLAFDGHASPASRPPTFRDVWPSLANLRPSQAALEQACQDGIRPGLAIIEAPMGEGKTEAAFYLAECWNRMAGREGAYIALPTQATSKQMHSRYEKFVAGLHPNTPAPRLVHGMAWLLDDTTPERAPQTSSGDEGGGEAALEWFQNQKRALLAPHGVGTVDQALMSALHVKHGFLRLFGLSGKVLIIDEVHAYDEYMTVIMERLLAWCRCLRIPVILLSATLSHRQKARLIEAYGGEPKEVATGAEDKEAYPLLTFLPLDATDPAGKPVTRDRARDRTVQIRRHTGFLEDHEKTVSLTLGLVEDGGCACILANTVHSAQGIFKALQAKAHDAELFLFHARYTADRREEIESEITKRFGKGKDGRPNPERPRRAIVVGTQVLEQSLDLDWDVLVSEIAPIDLLLQRAGRLWRHDGTPRHGHTKPVLHVLLPPDGDITFGPSEIKWAGGKGVYHRAPLLRTLELLLARESIELPREFRPLIEGCYGAEPPPPGVVPQKEMGAATKAWRDDSAGAANEAREHLIPPPRPAEFPLASTPRQPVGEHEEGGANSYFRARTRRGDDTRTVLVLNDTDLIELCRRDKRPSRDALKRLFLRKANLPAWWLAGLTPAEGHEDPFDGPKWLRGAVVLPLQGREWHGRAGERNAVIRDDEALGLVFQHM